MMAHLSSSLLEQMDRLKKSMQKRENKRSAERNGRMERSHFDGSITDVYGQVGSFKRQRQHLGGVQWGSAAAAVAASSQLGQIKAMVCDMCQVTFSGEAEMHQHLQGPVHLKTLQKIQAQKMRMEQLGKNRDLAESAVAAGSWHGQHGASPKTHQHVVKPSANGSRQHEGNVRFSDAPMEKHAQLLQKIECLHSSAHPHEEIAKRAASQHTHDQLLRQARGHEEAALSIGGWVPPRIPAADAGQNRAKNEIHCPASVSKSNHTIGDDPAIEAPVLQHVEWSTREEYTLGIESDRISLDVSGDQQLPTCAQVKLSNLVVVRELPDTVRNDSSAGSDTDDSNGNGAPVPFFTF